MNKTILSLLFGLVLLLSIATTPALAAPGGPSEPGWLPCRWNGQLYPHGAFRYAYFIGPNGQIIRYDVYQCQNTRWLYRYSSDDKN